MNETTENAAKAGKHSNRTPKVILFVVAIIALAGLGVSIELTRIHYFTHTDPSYQSVCAVNAKINCETVAQSPYSVFLGLPISVWGILVYAAYFLLSVWGLSKWRLTETWATGVLFCMSVFGFAASAALAYISFFKIDSMCLFCMALYAINTTLFVLGTVYALKNRVNPLSLLVTDLISMFRKPFVVVSLAIIVVVIAGAAESMIPPYWEHIGWAELPDLPKGVDSKGDHWIGARDPLVTVVEFSDYECPYCRRAHRNIRGMTAEFQDTVRLVHRHQPLDEACNDEVKQEFHKRACEFATASECAGEQGKFWEMNDAIFSVQDTIKAANVDIDKIAVQLGLDVPKFEECMRLKKPMSKLKRDMTAAKKMGIMGTPTFFIGNRAFEGGFQKSELEQAIERAKKKKISLDR